MSNGKLLLNDGVTEAVSYDFGLITAGAVTGIKFGFMNEKSRIVTPTVRFIQQNSNDMYEFMKAVLDDQTLSCPPNVQAELVAQVHGLVSDTYYYVLTAYNGNGETGQSLEVAIEVTGSSYAPRIFWEAVTEAQGYKIYRSIESGVYANCLLSLVTGGGTSFIDIGNAVTGGTPPTENTTAGGSPHYGTPPVSGYSSYIELGEVSAGGQVFLWAKPDPPYSVDEEDNPRYCQLRITE